MARNRTPPYLSNQAEVEHVDLASLDHTAAPILILCSDGLVDLYSRRSKVQDISQAVLPWITALDRKGETNIDNLAQDLLWDSLGGDAGVETSSKIIQGITSGRRVDDTTAIVLRL